MYPVGAHHPHKLDSQQLLERCIAGGERLVVDAEVFQEILRRYVAIQRRDANAPAFEVLLGVVDETFPVKLLDVERARAILSANAVLSARDALHVAVMERRGIERIISFDTGFDRVPGVTRLSS